MFEEVEKRKRRRIEFDIGQLESLSSLELRPFEREEIGLGTREVCEKAMQIFQPDIEGGPVFQDTRWNGQMVRSTYRTNLPDAYYWEVRVTDAEGQERVTARSLFRLGSQANEHFQKEFTVE